MTEVGDYLKNSPWQEMWTCPACGHDHHGEVEACEGCNTPLSCTTVMEPVSVCTIVDPDDKV